MYQVVKYGEQGKIITLDENGSTVTTHEVIHEYQTMKEENYYRIRVKVANKQEELKEYMKFSEDIKEHKDWKDTSFHVELPVTNIDGSYFVIKCYKTVVQ